MSKVGKLASGLLLWTAGACAGAAWAQAGGLAGITCPPTAEDPPKSPLGVVMRRPPDFVRYWPQTWVCQPRIESVANLWLAQVTQETDAKTGRTYHVLEPVPPPEPSPWPRWHARLSWKLLLSAGGNGEEPATLIVRAEYEQPSLARFDLFVTLTANGVTGISSRVLDEGASEACLKVRNDCRHAEEIVLEIPREALRSAGRNGLLIDLMGHGRTERLAIGKEALWAFGGRAGLR